MFPEHEALCSSIFEDALTIINLIKAPDNPFYGELQRTTADLLAKEDVIRAYEQERGSQQVARDIRTVLSNQQNLDGLLAIIGAAKQTFRRAGLAPLRGDIAEDTATK
jgi:hypothetical protein